MFYRINLVLVRVDVRVADNRSVTMVYHDFFGVCLPHFFRFLQKGFHEMFPFLLTQKFQYMKRRYQDLFFTDFWTIWKLWYNSVLSRQCDVTSVILRKKKKNHCNIWRLFLTIAATKKAVINQKFIKSKKWR